MQNNWIQIGKIKDAHGLKGELYVLVFSGEVSWLRNIKFLGLEQGQNLKKYDIIKAKAFKEGFLVSLAGIQDRNQSEALKGALVSISAEHLVSKKGETIYLSEIMDFDLIDQNAADAEAPGQLVGKIKSTANYGGHDLLMVEGKKENGQAFEYEIPFVAQFIVDLDFENKKVIMKLPAGLLSIQSDSSPASQKSDEDL